MQQKLDAAILVLAYNRPVHLQYTLQYLEKSLAHGPELPVSAYQDGAPTAKASPEWRAVNKMLSEQSLVSELRTGDANLGCSGRLLSSLREVLEEYDAAIILEDDCCPSLDFVKVMQAGLTTYRDEARVQAVCATNPLIVQQRQLPQVQESFQVGRVFIPHGWATYRRAFAGFNLGLPHCQEILADVELRRRFNAFSKDYYADLLEQSLAGELNWDIEWYAYLFMRGGFTLYPKESLVYNTGINGGTHWRARTVHLPRHKQVLLALGVGHQSAYLAMEVGKHRHSPHLALDDFSRPVLAEPLTMPSIERLDALADQFGEALHA